MRMWNRLAVALMVGLLAACAQGTRLETETELAVASGPLDTTYEGTLDASGQLALGTMRHEGSDNAVTPDQAADLLPLWQALQSGALQGDTETQAVPQQVEKAMTPDQLADIAAMDLTQDDVQSWMQEHGVVVRAGGADLPEREEGQPGDGSGEGDGVHPEIATRMAEHADMNDEDRQAMRDERHASGTGHAGGEAMLGWSSVLGPLVEMLSDRSPA